MATLIACHESLRRRLVGIPKRLGYENHQNTLEELKNNIEREIRANSLDMLEKSVNNSQYPWCGNYPGSRFMD